MKEDIQRKLFDHLLKNKISNFVGVPDSTMKYFIDQGLKKKKVLITTREEEAIGIAVGMTLSQSNSLVFMQNAGFANSISTITSSSSIISNTNDFFDRLEGFSKK